VLWTLGGFGVKNRQEIGDQAFADRLVSYSDAVVALAFIVSSGLGLAIADPDTRATITDVASGMIIGNAILGAIFSVLLTILRRWELDLRADTFATDKYKLYSHRIYLARHVVIWLSVTQTVMIMLALGI
jgi:hypothetical protein